MHVSTVWLTWTCVEVTGALANNWQCGVLRWATSTGTWPNCVHLATCSDFTRAFVNPRQNHHQGWVEHVRFPLREQGRVKFLHVCCLVVTDTLGRPIRSSLSPSAMFGQRAQGVQRHEGLS